MINEDNNFKNENNNVFNFFDNEINSCNLQIKDIKKTNKEYIKKIKEESSEEIKKIKSNIKYDKVLMNDIVNLSNNLNLEPMMNTSDEVENKSILFLFSNKEVFSFSLKSYYENNYNKEDLFKAFKESEDIDSNLKTILNEEINKRNEYNRLPLDKINRNLDNIVKNENSNFVLKAKQVGKRLENTVGNLFIGASSYTLANTLTSKLNTEIIADYSEKMSPFFQSALDVGLNYAIPAIVGAATLVSYVKSKKRIK